MMKLFFFVKIHFVKEFFCLFSDDVATVLKRKDIVVTRSPNLPSNKKVRHVQKKNQKKLKKIMHVQMFVYN